MNDENMSILKKAKKKLIIKLIITYAIGGYRLFYLFVGSLYTDIFAPSHISISMSPVDTILAMTIIGLIICTSFFLMKNFLKLKKQIETGVSITVKQRNNWFVMIAIILIGIISFFVARYYSLIPISDLGLLGDLSRNVFNSYFL